MKHVPIRSLAVMLFVFASCGKGDPAPVSISRMIDHLNEDSIRRSPILDSSESRISAIENFPDSMPFSDSEIGGNPFGLKRKLNSDGASINILLAPPGSEYVFEPVLPNGGYLSFGTGILLEDPDSHASGNADHRTEGVTFIIQLESDGRRRTIYQHFQSPVRDKVSQKRTYRMSIVSRLELPPLRPNMRIILRTEGPDNLSAFWHNPVVFSEVQDPRLVILISIDTLRADHLGCYGYPRETSPAIDALAKDGALFLNTFATSPWTLPSHVSLMTSLFNHNHGVNHENDRMDPLFTTLADLLRADGFSCSAFTGGGFISPLFGFDKGFDSYQTGEGGVFHHNSAERIFRAVSNWLERHQGRDGFLFIHTYQPHSPYHCPDPYNTMFLGENPKWAKIDIMNLIGGFPGLFTSLTEEERENIIGLYDGEIRYTDEALVRALVRKLKDLSLYDSALIILTSDHGEEFFDHGGWSHGQTLYNEMLHVPLIIKFPRGQYQGREVSSIVRLVDVFPTITDYFGITHPDLQLDGKSLLPILKGREKGDRTFLADFGSYLFNSRIGQKISMNEGPYKLILNKIMSEDDLAYFTSPPPPVERIELYDLAKDLREKFNLTVTKGYVARALHTSIMELYKNGEKKIPLKAEFDEKIEEQLRALGYIR